MTAPDAWRRTAQVATGLACLALGASAALALPDVAKLGLRGLDSFVALATIGGMAVVLYMAGAALAIGACLEKRESR